MPERLTRPDRQPGGQAESPQPGGARPIRRRFRRSSGPLR
ncbi:hypothetical protein SFR_4274 [Streptomyces sp. FR-008]|nr:hypothetical protein SFR_4274 [Streptomyces sp. FR-008]